MYHAIGGDDGVPVEAFERQVSALASRRRVVPLAEAVELLGHPEAGACAAITFDDGYRDFAELAVPVLAAQGLHATLFVPGGFLGRTNRWDTGVATERPIMTGRELRALDPSIVTIGAHGLTHRRLSRLAPEVLRAETEEARRIIEDACGRPVTLFAYPHGQADDFDMPAERAVEAAGFVAACSTRYGRGSHPSERFRLRRVGIGPREPLALVERKLDGAYDWIALKEGLGARVRACGRFLTRRMA
jgi:peptidoglycan/xylan/chitin deacetylase (PgdA/CDA1 family)